MSEIRTTFIEGKSIFSGKSLKIGMKNGIVDSVSETSECHDFLSPGFMDIQINGYNFKDYSSDLSSEQIKEMVFDIAESGTTKHLATIITNSESSINISIKNIIKARKAYKEVENAIVGIHLEGPFISPETGARGVHDPLHIKSTNIDSFLKWQNAAEGLIRIITISPEDETSISFIKEVTKMGVIVAIGHTNVSTELIEKAVDAGARLSTHLGNGCPELIPRLKNIIWKQLGDERLTTSIISDGFHLPSEVLNCFFNCKGKDNTILVSDVAPLAGSKPGLYKWGNMDIEVFKDGHMGLYQTNNLAGAASLLDKCVSHFVKKTSCSLQDGIRCATVNPRKLLGIDYWDSDPIIGNQADFILFSHIDGNLKIKKTINADMNINNNYQEK